MQILAIIVVSSSISSEIGSGIDYTNNISTAISSIDHFLNDTEYFSRHILIEKADNNRAPQKPSKPSGSLTGKAGVEYTYTCSTIHPDGDDIYYLFDWGDGTKSEWLGPYTSGSTVSITNIWSQKGTYKITVKANDTNGLESIWSDSLQVDISGPYITFREIEGGLGLTVEIENIGNEDARDVELNLEISGGVIIKPSVKRYEIPTISVNESYEIHIKILGIGLGIAAKLPSIFITVSSPEIKTRGKTVIARILGPFLVKVGEYWSSDEAFEGYTLFNPVISLNSFLINNSGNAPVHTWSNTYKPALSVYLLEDGNILRTAFPRFNPVFWGGGIGGRVEIIDWNGSLVWEFEYTNSQYCLHHDVEMLPNGNILMIAWEYKSASEAIAAGRDPNSLPMGQMWSDKIIEVKPNGSSGGDIVWEWRLWDHLIQDFDPTKDNYGVVKDHPELVDINYGGKFLADWTHINSVDYNEEFDQILLSVLNFNEIWVIDHSTTTEEAAGHTGGNSGKGGDILYRWGNPQTYRAGSSNDQTLFRQHDARWISKGCPGEGNILVFNNGKGRPGQEYSSVDEIVPPVDNQGNYTIIPGSAYGPEEPIWSYTAENPIDFFSTNLAGAQRLPNGNTLICDGVNGLFFEVTSQKEIVWQYLNQDPNLFTNHVFKINRYPPEYPGLKYLLD